MLKKLLVCGLSVAIFVGAIVKQNKTNATKPVPETPSVKYPSSPDIDEYLFGHKTHEELESILLSWESKAEDLVDVGNYGQTTSGKKHLFIKISNEYKPSDKVVLITACIHGNEPWSTSTVMAYAGKLLSSYGRDEAITELVNSRTIYIVPVVSPDTYPNSRNVQGTDPNRDFPTLKNPDKNSVEPVQALREFFLKIKPNSVLSGHTFGRVFLIPWGDSTVNCPDIDAYKRIASKMCELSNYKYQRACEMYNRPIYGTEIDWYYRNGAFAMVMEFGTHQRKPSLEDTTSEFNKTFEAFVYFVQESPVALNYHIE